MFEMDDFKVLLARKEGTGRDREATALALANAEQAEALVDAVLERMRAVMLPERRELLDLLDAICRQALAGGRTVSFRDAVGARIRRVAAAIVPPRSEAAPTATSPVTADAASDPSSAQLYRAAAAVITAEQDRTYQEQRTLNKFALKRVLTGWWRTGAVSEAAI